MLVLLAALVPALCAVPLQLRKPNHSQRQITMAVKDQQTREASKALDLLHLSLPWATTTIFG
jgi:hypothetical protein